VTESNSPPNGSKQTAAPSQPAASGADDKSEAKLRQQPASIPAALVQRPRLAAVPSDHEVKSGFESLTNGGTRSAVPPLRSRAATESLTGRRSAAAGAMRPRESMSYSAESVTAGNGAGESYPPLSERFGTGTGMASVDSNRSDPTRFAPRSPRTALEPDTVELPTRRSRVARHPLVIIGNALFSIFVLAAIAGGVLLFAGKQRFDAPGPLPEDRIVNIPHGSGIRDIADVLQRGGVIDQPWVFIGGVLVLKAREGLKAGEYQFKAHASLRDVVETIVDGKVVPHQISIPEGLTSQQIVARLLDDDVLTGNISEIPSEGSVLPDTYNFTRGVAREQMIQRMQLAQQRLLKEIWDRRAPDLPIKTPEQLVVLASLIEKETSKPEERTRVAAVFVNRLKQKMRLQSDPTIIYGLVGGKGTLGRPIMKSEIDQPTPYNTYQIDGLPPGPICNPGRASLEAAANPARTREIYFVADGSGGHLFAETYEQHQKNVARLRLIESDQKDQSPADATANAPATQAAAVPAASIAPAAPAAPAPPSHRKSAHRRQARPLPQ
jgi:UPF0755 protein